MEEDNLLEKKEVQEQIVPEEKENTVANKCVFVSGIPYDTSEEQLRELFAPCGVIKQIKIPKYQDSGRNIGYAHIFYKKNKELNKTYIGTRYINVAMSNGEKTNKNERKADGMEVPAGCTNIFIKNLPYDVTEEEVGNIFKPCGEIKSIRFVYNTSANHFKGFGYIEFEDSTAVSNALKLNGKQIKGRNMIVDFEDSGPKMGYKYRTEVPSKFNKDYNDIMKKTLSKKRKRTNNH